MEEREEKRKISIPLGFIIFVLIVIAGFAFYFETSADNVTVRGLSKYSEEEFLEKAGLTGIYKNTYLFMLKDRNRTGSKIPYIDAYYVEMKDKNTLEFQVYETGPIGCVKIMNNYFSFDKDGTVIKSSLDKPLEVPLITGLEFDEIIMFRKLKVPRQNVFEVVLELIKMVQKYDLKINEIQFGEGLDVTLYTDNLTVLLGIHDKYDALITALSGVYKEASERGGTIDLRNYSENNQDIILRAVGN